MMMVLEFLLENLLVLAVAVMWLYHFGELAMTRLRYEKRRKHG